jgi:hypothetical protein
MGEDEYIKDDDITPDIARDNGDEFPVKQLFFLGTRHLAHPNSTGPFYESSLIFIALCRIAEPVALTLVFPFSASLLFYLHGIGF